MRRVAIPFAVNLHGSLLPRWRGAAPVQRAVHYGDAESGVTLQKIALKLDAGDVLGVRKVQITDVGVHENANEAQPSKGGIELRVGAAVERRRADEVVPGLAQRAASSK